ncbi:unnamed protein product [Mytilus edulis]|uniref:Uncharacterized protein n=1 Tax=Mytilus edulis TaxID=6550 RepID=A0A8S3UPZ4_MYTED|nr:unnamed protein product [Mytilus edulis]
MAQERETISKGHWKSLSNKYKTNVTRERDNIRVIKILCPINTKQMAQRERQYQRVIGNPLSNKYKQTSHKRETISKGLLVKSLSNKYKQMAQEREILSSWSLETLSNKQKFKQGTRERQYQRVTLKPLSNKYKTNGTRERDNIKGSLEILCPISKQTNEQETIPKGHWKLSNKGKQMAAKRDNIKGSLKLCPINTTNVTRERENLCPINTNTKGTRERDNIKGFIGNPLSNKYKQMAQERETISKGHRKLLSNKYKTQRENK